MNPTAIKIIPATPSSTNFVHFSVQDGTFTCMSRDEDAEPTGVTGVVEEWQNDAQLFDPENTKSGPLSRRRSSPKKNFQHFEGMFSDFEPPTAEKSSSSHKSSFFIQQKAATKPQKAPAIKASSKLKKISTLTRGSKRSRPDSPDDFDLPPTPSHPNPSKKPRKVERVSTSKKSSKQASSSSSTSHDPTRKAQTRKPKRKSRKPKKPLLLDEYQDIEAIGKGKKKPSLLNSLELYNEDMDSDKVKQATEQTSASKLNFSIPSSQDKSDTAQKSTSPVRALNKNEGLAQQSRLSSDLTGLSLSDENKIDQLGHDAKIEVPRTQESTHGADISQKAKEVIEISSGDETDDEFGDNFNLDEFFHMDTPPVSQQQGPVQGATEVAKPSEKTAVATKNERANAEHSQIGTASKDDFSFKAPIKNLMEEKADDNQHQVVESSKSTCEAGSQDLEHGNDNARKESISSGMPSATMVDHRKMQTKGTTTNKSLSGTSTSLQSKLPYKTPIKVEGEKRKRLSPSPDEEPSRKRLKLDESSTPEESDDDDDDTDDNDSDGDESGDDEKSVRSNASSRRDDDIFGTPASGPMTNFHQMLIEAGQTGARHYQESLPEPEPEANDASTTVDIAETNSDAEITKLPANDNRAFQKLRTDKLNMFRKPNRFTRWKVQVDKTRTTVQQKMHDITSAIGRHLRTKEEGVRGIVAEYRQHGNEVLAYLEAEHALERAKAESQRVASRRTLVGAVSRAGDHVSSLLGRLRDVSIEV